jgi:hypothetical protein
MTVGEPITYVDTIECGTRGNYQHGFRKGLSHSRVEQVWAGGQVVFGHLTAPAQFIVERNGSPFFLTVDEGVLWVHGHHAENSEVGRALLASYALYWCAA